MKSTIKLVYKKTLLTFSRYVRFVRDFLRFQKLQEVDIKRFGVLWKDRYPILNEKTTSTIFDTHYIYHPAWAARNIALIQPAKHVDISSSLSFCTILSAFVPVEFYDYRPAKLNLNNLISKQTDLLNLPFEDESIESISCMHVIEHIGLGRYGDPLDPDADLKAISELKRVIKPGGSLFFVAPVGHPKIAFNAHRIYSYYQITEYFKGLTTKQFALIDDQGNFSLESTPEYATEQEYGCGCWWFTKAKD